MLFLVGGLLALVGVGVWLGLGSAWWLVVMGLIYTLGVYMPGNGARL